MGVFRPIPSLYLPIPYEVGLIWSGIKGGLLLEISSASRTLPSIYLKGITFTFNSMGEGGAFWSVAPSKGADYLRYFGGVRRYFRRLLLSTFTRYSSTLRIFGFNYRISHLDLKDGYGIMFHLGFGNDTPFILPTHIQVELVYFKGSTNNGLRISGLDYEEILQLGFTLRGVHPCNIYTGKGIAFLGEKVRQKKGKEAFGR